MANPVCDVLLTKKPLEARGSDVDLACGAVVEFQGIVRATENGREIAGIEYEAHADMAEHQLKEIARDAIEKFALSMAVVHHRVGFVPAGETSLLVRTGSGHRAAAFEASQWMIDQIKTRVPIWKHPRDKIDNPPADLIRAKPQMVSK
jgi:molybdopterin synthase catalytic subunit